MASVVNRNTNEYRASVDTVQFTDSPWMANPDVSQVLNETEQIPTLYWIVPAFPDVVTPISADRVSWKRSIKVADLDNERTLQEEMGFEFNGNVYIPTEEENRDLYSTMAANVRYGTPIPPDYFWRTSDGQNIAITDSEALLQIFTKFNERKDSIRRVYYTKLDEINSLTTEEQIDNYDVTTGWPPL